MSIIGKYITTTSSCSKLRVIDKIRDSASSWYLCVDEDGKVLTIYPGWIHKIHEPTPQKPNDK